MWPPIPTRGPLAGAAGRSAFVGVFVAVLFIKTLWAIAAYAVLALALHLRDHFNGGQAGSDELSSPELSDRNQRIADLEKRFRDLENR